MSLKDNSNVKYEQVADKFVYKYTCLYVNVNKWQIQQSKFLRIIINISFELLKGQLQQQKEEEILKD